MTDPVIGTFTTGQATSADDVYTNDANLVAVFGAMDITDNVTYKTSQLVIGPIRTRCAETETPLFQWTVPTSMDASGIVLRELHVSVMDASTGDAVGPGTVNGTDFITFHVETDTANAGAWASVGTLVVNSVDSFTLDLSSDSDRTVARQGHVRIKTVKSGTPVFHACITILAHANNKAS
ncbi:hypothetical protein CMI37_12320 [Candidatus Pacearchaeota archaeon]|nr:hypothetical protein [Candidatus Pacearchaeota archaeon]|tara:strand:- start:1670 stop:2209 length:540 start_codon:yes stop_codon:yes gene_type:complete